MSVAILLFGVLITFILLVVVFSVCRQSWVVAGLICSFSSLDLV
jgi:hypothetical protein